MRKIIQITFFLLAGVMLLSCKKEENLSPEAQLAKDVEKIQAYLSKKNLTAQSTASGLALHH